MLAIKQQKASLMRVMINFGNLNEEPCFYLHFKDSISPNVDLVTCRFTTDHADAEVDIESKDVNEKLKKSQPIDVTVYSGDISGQTNFTIHNAVIIVPTD